MTHGADTMPVLTLLGGLRRYARSTQRLDAASVGAALAQGPLPHSLVFHNGRLNDDIAVLVNGRNIAFLNGLDTPLAPADRMTVFFHGARGFPGG